MTKSSTTIAIRIRLVYIMVFLLTIGAGLASRSSSISLPRLVEVYSGDILWASMVYWMFCIVQPKVSIIKISLSAILFACSVEMSQLYQEPWLNTLRSYRLGGLILGYGFKVSDLVCYLLGVLLAASADLVFFKKDV